MTTNVLFSCPHAAGKSLVAATYFRAAAARRELDVQIAVAGLDPDPQNMPNVVAALEAQGYGIGWSPKLIDGGTRPPPISASASAATAHRSRPREQSWNGKSPC
jgi:hypothetical protein